MSLLMRRDLSESFQQYALRNKTLCTCSSPHVVSTLRQPWTHHEGCPQANLYLSWRAYVGQVFPNRVCLLPKPSPSEPLPWYLNGV